MKKLNIFGVFLLLAIVGNAQTNTSAKCYGWGTDLNDYPPPTPIIMLGFDRSVINAEDIENDINKDQPWRFGYKYKSDLSLTNAGEWVDVENGRVWRLVINCPEALTINLLLKNLFIPEGATLFLYNEGRTNKIGAYTSRNNREEGELGTELIHGETIIIEYFEPTLVAGTGTLTIENIIHGYRGLNQVQKDLSKSLHDAGDCNEDVNCPLGDGWEEQIRSVAMIIVGGNGICTGALINNTCSTRRPLFLTANHCVGGSTANWSFRFNWESPEGTESCATVDLSTNPGPPYNQTANGAVVLESESISDYALLEIDNLSFEEQEDWEVFFAGWDHSDAETVTEATGIHHPRGDLKKICRENESPYHAVAAGAQVWWIDDWDQGVTEPGSSGSPLFDENHRIIGQLYGGAAACSGTDDNDAYDYYGRFGISWVNGASDHLIEDDCADEITNDGYDPTISCEGEMSSEETEESCFGDDSGEIIITITAGEAPYTFDIGDGPEADGLFPDLSQGTYTVTVIDNVGCEDDITVILGGPSALDISYTTENEVLGSDGSINLSVSGGTPGYTYAWTGPDGFIATDEDPDGLVGGLYTVIVTDQNECTILETHIEVSSSVSIQENELGIRIFPNPSNGQFTIDNNGNLIQSISVSDLSGRTILFTSLIGDNSFLIDLSEIANGTYLIEIKTDSTTHTQRIVKH